MKSQSYSWLLEGIDQDKVFARYQKNVSQAEKRYAKIKTIHSRTQNKSKTSTLSYKPSFFHLQNKVIPKNSATLAPSSPAPRLRRATILEKLISSQEPQSWLNNLIAFAEEMPLCPDELRNAKNCELESLYNSFLDPEHMNLIHNLFYFKIHPEDLVEKNLPPEKFIFLQTRLSSLYYYVEFIQQKVITILEERGLKPLKDYLFHGETLPLGIYIHTPAYFKSIIIDASKNLRSKNLSLEKKSNPLLTPLLNLYKDGFQFKRLIDVIINLKIKLIGTKELDTQEYLVLKEKLLFLYQALTTDQCIDLYGYFSSQEYLGLKKNLDLIAEGKELAGLEDLNLSARKAVKQVSLYLKAMNQSLEECLKQRQFLIQDSKDFEVKIKTKSLDIKEAVQRILGFF